MLSNEEFTNQMDRLVAVFGRGGRTPHDHSIRMQEYYHKCCRYSAQDFREAVDNWIETGDRFPLVSDLKKRAKSDSEVRGSYVSSLTTKRDHALAMADAYARFTVPALDVFQETKERDGGGRVFRAVRAIAEIQAQVIHGCDGIAWEAPLLPYDYMTSIGRIDREVKRYANEARHLSEPRVILTDDETNFLRGKA